MKLPCAVTRDLLPLYAEELVEQETQALIEEHLTGCSACRAKLSEFKTETSAPIETAKPLQSLKKQLQKRRLYSAVIAVLCVFIAVYAWFYHANERKLVSWEEGLIQAAGIEQRPYDEVFGQTDAPDEPQRSNVDVLILRVDNRITGTSETLFMDDDGSRTVLLQGWTSGGSGYFIRDYNEMILYPVPDRVMYVDSVQQHLLWGKPLDGGVEILPRLALGYYLLLALAATFVLGLAWFFLRRRKNGWIVRQLFFAPASYLGAHFLMKGFHTVSDFMAHDFFNILLIAIALYALISLTWQVFLQWQKEA